MEDHPFLVVFHKLFPLRSERSGLQGALTSGARESVEEKDSALRLRDFLYLSSIFILERGSSTPILHFILTKHQKTPYFKAFFGVSHEKLLFLISRGAVFLSFQAPRPQDLLIFVLLLLPYARAPCLRMQPAHAGGGVSSPPYSFLDHRARPQAKH